MLFAANLLASRLKSAYIDTAVYTVQDTWQLCVCVCPLTSCSSRSVFFRCWLQQLPLSTVAVSIRVIAIA